MKIERTNTQTKFVLAKRQSSNGKDLVFAYVAKDGIRKVINEGLFSDSVLAGDSPQILRYIRDCDPILRDFEVYEVQMVQKTTIKVKKFRIKSP